MKNASISPRERQRQAQDLILVYNPTAEDHRQSWDRVIFVIPSKDRDMGYGNGLNAIPRYVAENYVKTMTDKILGEKLLEAIKEENDRRIKAGLKEMDKYMGGEMDNFAKQFGVNSESARTEVFPMLWKGIYKQYGAEDMMVTPQDEAPKDNRSLEERLADQYDFPAQTPQEPRMEESEPEAPTEDELLEEKKNEAIADVI